jgi:hypothetical protein
MVVDDGNQVKAKAANVADAASRLERVDLRPKPPRRPRVMYETQVGRNVPPGGIGDLVAVVRFGAVNRREYLCIRDWLDSTEVRAVHLVESSGRLR